MVENRSVIATARDGETGPTELQQARTIYSMRRRRDAAFADFDLLGEPGWDILLDLFIGEMEGARIQVSSVCLDARVPSTTILRWLTRLERDRLIYRVADNIDGRRRFVRLTDQGRELMRRAIRDIAVHETAVLLLAI